MTVSAATIVLPLFLATTSGYAIARQATPARTEVSAPTTLDAAARQEVVTSFSKALRERYVFPDTADRIATAIGQAMAAGRYDTLADPVAFAQRLSADAAAIARDKHLKVRSLTMPPAGMTGPMPRAEAGVFRADRLAGDVGYLEVISFPPPPMFKPVLDRAMAGLTGSRALIVDVRRNHGGAPPAVAYLVSYLATPGRPINEIVSRTERTNEFTRQTYRSVPTPVSFAGVPTYVLTSKNTFSGGEEFAYDMQALKRGLLIGEVTGGGANPTGSVDLGHGIEATIPFGRAENPYTKTNWEGRGVQPDVPTPAADAFQVALVRAGGKPMGDVEAASQQRVFTPRTVPRPGSEQALRRLLAGYASGKPDYAALTPEVADTTRQQLSELRAEFVPLGPLQSVTFLGPDMLGGDEYELHFAHGARMMALVIGPAGKVAAISSAMPLMPVR